MAAKKSKETFEELYRRLEETVAKLEEGGLPLERSLALYEDGMTLARRCQEMLDTAEVRIRQLRETLAAPSEAEAAEEEIPWDDAES
ncbi:MAG: exodeoxyribonuclease VII small subunit [Dehalococcoidia bacterium]|jgi:exodeoxyribonuclease VII small subunit